MIDIFIESYSNSINISNAIATMRMMPGPIRIRSQQWTRRTYLLSDSSQSCWHTVIFNHSNENSAIYVQNMFINLALDMHCRYCSYFK